MIFSRDELNTIAQPLGLTCRFDDDDIVVKHVESGETRRLDRQTFEQWQCRGNIRRTLRDIVLDIAGELPA